MVSRVRLASVNADELSNQASVPGRADWLYENSSNLLMSPDEPSTPTPRGAGGVVMRRTQPQYIYGLTLIMTLEISRFKRFSES